jgi:hypothetical protein
MLGVVRTMCCGRARDVQVSLPAKIYAVAVVVESALLLSLAISILVEARRHDETQALVYALMSIISVLFWCLMGVDAVLSENRLEYWAASAASLMFTIFIVWEFALNSTGLGSIWRQLRTAALAVRVSFQVGHLILFHFVDREFGWMSYKVVGNDIVLQAVYEVYRGFVSLLRVDMFTFALMLVLARFYLFTSSRRRAPSSSSASSPSSSSSPSPCSAGGP